MKLTMERDDQSKYSLIPTHTGIVRNIQNGTEIWNMAHDGFIEFSGIKTVFKGERIPLHLETCASVRYGVQIYDMAAHPCNWLSEKWLRDIEIITRDEIGEDD